MNGKVLRFNCFFIIPIVFYIFIMLKVIGFIWYFVDLDIYKIKNSLKEENKKDEI